MDKITITKDQFMDAVRVANDRFKKIGEECKDEGGTKPLTLMLTCLQNIAFSSLLADELFNKNKEENTEDK